MLSQSTGSCGLRGEGSPISRPPTNRGPITWYHYHVKQNITRIESVQRRFTKRLNGLRISSYATRLSYLGLDSLQCRRTKADLSMCHKIINNYICTQVVSLFTFSSTKQTRGHSRKLDKSLFVTVIPSPNTLSMCGIPSPSVL